MSMRPLRPLRSPAQSAKGNHETAIERQKLASTFGSWVDPWEFLVISGQSEKASLSLIDTTLLASACISFAKATRSFFSSLVESRNHKTGSLNMPSIQLGTCRWSE